MIVGDSRASIPQAVKCPDPSRKLEGQDGWERKDGGCPQAAAGRERPQSCSFDLGLIWACIENKNENRMEMDLCEN